MRFDAYEVGDFLAMIVRIEGFLPDQIYRGLRSEAGTKRSQLALDAAMKIAFPTEHDGDWAKDVTWQCVWYRGKMVYGPATPDGCVRHVYEAQEQTVSFALRYGGWKILPEGDTPR